MTKPFAGLRVVDLTRMIVGPTATMLLGDLGADVVKIEPKAGDDTRYQQTRHDPEGCPFFLALNRNKRGIVLDLTDPRGGDVLLRLAAGADVVVHNFRPGIVEKLRVAYDDIKAVKPDVIYCSISAFGEVGPYAKRPGTDILFQAMGGLMSVTGEPDGRPLRAGAPIIDVTTGVSAAFAIAAALIRRMRTGQGDYVQASLFQQTAFMQAPMMTWAMAEDQNPPRLGNRSPMALILDLPTSDGYVMVALPTPKFWAIFCDAASRPELATDPRFLDHPSRLLNQQAMMDIIEPSFREQTTAYWMGKLLARGVPAGNVQDYMQVLRDPQVEALGALWTVERDGGPAVKVPGLPFRLEGVPVSVDRRPPTLGRDTGEVLRELGYTEEEARTLQSDGVTAPSYQATP